MKIYRDETDCVIQKLRPRLLKKYNGAVHIPVTDVGP